MIDVNELIKSALKNKSQIELNVYRSIKTKITEFKSAKNAKDYTEAAEIQLLDKMRRERDWIVLKNILKEGDQTWLQLK